MIIVFATLGAFTMRLFDLGRVLLGLAFAVLGGLAIGWYDVFHALQLPPKWFPWPHAYALAAGAIMLGSGLAILIPRTARTGALVLAAFLIVQTLVVYSRLLVLYPLNVGVYELLAEQLSYIAGAWTIYTFDGNSGFAKFADVRAARILFGLALIPFGVSHFVYMNMTAPLIPSYLPAHVALGQFTGACHIAAGIGVLLSIGLAASLEAVMVSLFTVLVWIPTIAANPQAPSNWSEICSSVAVTGAAWLIAATFRDKAWSLSRNA